MNDKGFPALCSANLHADPIHVKHADLTRSSDDSRYRSECPVCGDGTLRVYRDPETLELLALDRCILCGQRVIYDDIEDLKRGELGETKGEGIKT